MSFNKSDQPSSPPLIKPETPKYNLRSKKRIKVCNDYAIEQVIHVKIDQDTDISVTDLIGLFYALIEYKNMKLKETNSDDIRNQMKTIDQIIEQNLVKLPSLVGEVNSLSLTSLVSVEEKELLISNIETNLQIQKKQFYYVILYYMINKHWSHIKKQALSLVRLHTFFKLLQFLLDNHILEKFDENSSGDDVFISYVIKAVAYLIVANDPRCSHQSVQDFTVVISAGFKLVDTSNQAFIQFFTLLRTILSTQFVIQLYCELINYEENVSEQTIEQSLQDILLKLNRNLYLANLPDYYCALTPDDGKLLLNNSERGLFKDIDKMITWNWDLNTDDEIMVQWWASLLIVIIHETAHSLRRTIVPKARNLILLQTPPKQIDENQNEAGFCLETLLFGQKIDSIGLRDGEYLLNVTNWKVLNVENFQNKFKQLTTEDKKQNKQSRLSLPSRCVQEPNYDSRIRIGHCGTSKYAICLNN